MGPSSSKPHLISTFSCLFPEKASIPNTVVRQMQYITFRKWFDIRETEFLVLMNPGIVFNFLNPAWPLRRNLVWTDIIQKVPLICEF
ncbi:hypothetical protein Enr10x_57420 [Gimesia panareensis]|uniref:Uncharacterized protein n=1 Tax=Gimesia panareensis TaxID=2527978 RepID=A0A517QFF8_9PLAN|nr:hypothetical protein Enr10x_57420 [Gimesia panareensis]